MEKRVGSIKNGCLLVKGLNWERLICKRRDTLVVNGAKRDTPCFEEVTGSTVRRDNFFFGTRENWSLVLLLLAR